MSETTEPSNTLRGRAGWAIKRADGKGVPRPLIVVLNDDTHAMICWGTSQPPRANAVMVELKHHRQTIPWIVSGHRLVVPVTCFYPKYAKIEISRILLGKDLVRATILAQLEAKIVGLTAISLSGFPPEDIDND